MKIKPQQTLKATENVWEGLRSGYVYLKSAGNIKLMILLMAFISF